MRAALLLAVASCCYGATNSLTVYEVDGVSQTGRVVSFNRVFAQGEIANTSCARPVVGGTPIADGNWQFDLKNSWPDNTIKIGIVSFIAPTFTAGGSLAVTFQAGTCSNTGLTKSQMQHFNSDGWSAQILVTANGATQTVDATTMLGALSVADCQVTYWLQGPVVTQAIVQDCTIGFAYDFGAHWDGSTMNLNGGAFYDTTSTYASLHPAFVLSFYPSTNTVKVEFIVENMWSNRVQDQRYSLSLKTGSTPTEVYAVATFNHAARTRWRKTFWSGTAPGHVRIDHNFAYLKSTLLFPNYDSDFTVSPTTDYATFIGGDKGEIVAGGNLGRANFIASYPSNNEGAIEQRETLLYLMNMGSCGAVNGTCAKAWDILTGEVDAHASNTLVGVSGGGGQWEAMSHVPTHLREARADAGVYFYCPTRDDKEAVPATACGGSVTQTGRGFSRDAHPTQSMGETVLPVAAVGTYTLGAFTGTADCSHWLDYSFVPYLLTGDWYFLEEEYQGANFCLSTISYGTGVFGSNGYYSYMSPSYYALPRIFAWGMLTVGRAAVIAPDGTVEKSFYTSKVKSNMEVQEGFMGITGTSLTPASPNTTCTGHSASTSNRWDWGRCTVAQGLTPSLYEISGGECPANVGMAVDSNYVDITKATDRNAQWQYWMVTSVLGYLNELGLPQVQSVAAQTQKRLIEMVLEPTFNPYAVAAVNVGVKQGAAECPSGTGTVPTTVNPYFTTWAEVLGAYPASVQTNQNMWHYGSHGQTIPGTEWANFPLGDHEYSLIARAAGTFVIGTTGSCTDGACYGSDAWAWLNVYDHAPYPVDAQVKWALTPRAVSVTGQALPAGAWLRAYSQTLSATGGTPPYVFSCTGGLPTGIALSSGGVLSGTMQRAGTFVFPVVATDDNGVASEPVNFSITTPPPVRSVSIGGSGKLGGR